MKLKFLTLLLVVCSNIVFSQDYNNRIQFLKKNSTHNESFICNGSSSIAKVEYLYHNYTGYVIIYFKDTYYNDIVKPYLYCNISRERWNSFVNSGKNYSWGNAFHDYIEAYKCTDYDNSYCIKPEYEMQQPQKSINVPLVQKALTTLEDRYNNGTSINNKNYNSNNNYKPENNIGYHNLNFKYSFGVGYGNGIVEIFNEFRIGDKTTLQTQFNKFKDCPNTDINIDYYKKQFGISCIYNYYCSIYSSNLFFNTGLGVSYSRAYEPIVNSFENKINPILNLGLNYSFEKLPISIGVHSKLDFGDYGNTGFSLKYIIK